MKIIRLITYGLLSLGLVAGLTGCSDDDPIPPFTVNFSTDELAISSSNPEAEVIVTFSRPAGKDGNVVLNLMSGSLTYGQSADYYTSVHPEDNSITLPYLRGDESVRVMFYAGSAADIRDDISIDLTISDDLDNNYTVGESNILSVVYAENFVSKGATMSANISGEFTHRAYFDLSKAASQVVNADNFDLGFYSGEGHYVTLNNSVGVMARPLAGRHDLNSVTPEDTVGFYHQMTIPPPGFDPSIGSAAWVDSPDGNLSTTAFGEISATDTENSVYIIRRPGKDWKKVRVLRTPSGYELQHANISATSFETLTIDKNTGYETVDFHFESGIVEASPVNDRWDFMYGSYTELLNLGGPGMDIPYGFKDYIVSNRDDVQISMVMSSEIAYSEFSLNDVSNLTFNGAINSIGSSWRQGGGPSAAPAVYTDRYYILQDGEGNTYKLKFTDMYDENDERGELSLTYELLD